jgi:hypothetical protein
MAYEARAKIENVEKKFNGTRLETASCDAIDTIQAIRSRGFHTRVKLGAVGTKNHDSR